MASTDEAAALTEAHRRRQIAVRGLAARDLTRILPLLDVEDVAGTWAAVESAITMSVTHRRNQSAALAADYFARFRAAEGVPGRFVPVSPKPLDPGYLARRLRFAGPVEVARLRAVDPTRVDPLLFSSLEGEVSMQVLDGGRSTIDGSVAADRECIGFVRVTDGDPCAFCAMLASRGPVFKSAQTATSGGTFSERVGGFRVHRRCGCTAEPVYREDTEWPGRAREFHDMWNQAQRDAAEAGELDRGTSNDALNAFRRALAKT